MSDDLKPGETSDFKISDEIKPSGMVTKVGGKKLDNWAGKAPMKKTDR